MHQPRQPHLNAAHRVLRYLKSTPGQGILMSYNSALNVKAYCDSDWASCPATQRSITGYITFLGESPISWKSKKQSIVSRSSAEAEYHSMATTTCELIWIKALLQDLGIYHCHPMELYCDNKAAVHITANPVFYERTKHIEIDCHLVREKLQAGIIHTSHLPSKEQIADIFTIALGCDQFNYLKSKLGVLDIHTPT